MGNTSVMMTMVPRATSEALTPSRLKLCSPWRMPPTSRHSPRIPLRMIMTAANTVSRASAEASLPPASISETISATSMSVTARARTSVP